MKTKAPQFDLPLPDEPFRLIGDRTEDGDRITADKANAELDRAESEAQQSYFTSSYENNPQ